MKKLMACVTVGVVLAAQVAFADTANVPTPVWQEEQTTYEQANAAGTAMSAEQLNQLLLSTGGVGTFSFTEANGSNLNINFRVFN